MIICCCHFLEHVKNITNDAFGTCEAHKYAGFDISSIWIKIVACRDLKNITQRLKIVIGTGTTMLKLIKVVETSSSMKPLTSKTYIVTSRFKNTRLFNRGADKHRQRIKGTKH